MLDRLPAAERLSRRIVIGVVAILLFGWVFLFRFNTLGGAFGGFDNDHFLYYTVAKQVEAGEQPLRDFQDAMHGAWPSLTYELSAAAQRYFGDNLRSEAWLTVSGVALGHGGRISGRQPASGHGRGRSRPRSCLRCSRPSSMAIRKCW